MLTEILELIFKVLEKELQNQIMGAIFSELVLKDKSKSIKSEMYYIYSENIFVEKYQVIMLFPWNSERTADASN